MGPRTTLLALLGAFACGMLTWGLGSPAQAAPPVHGAVDGRVLFEVGGRYGGALGADLWWGRGMLRGGLGLGLGALSASGGASSRVVTPFGLSLALAPASDERAGPIVTLRAGVLPGAQKDGFVLGGWGSCALGYRFALGEGASVRVGADGWLLLGEHGGLFWGPFVGLGF
jgi:hypothetical protein